MDIMIVLNYNDYDNTYHYIQSIKDYQCLDKIIVVDNNSTDNCYPKLEELRTEKVHVIKNNENLGYAHGNNFGIKYCEKEFSEIGNIVISNPDIIVSEESVKNILGGIDVSKNIVSTSGLIYNWNEEISRVFAWKVPTYGTLLMDTFVFIGRFGQRIINYSMFYDLPKMVKNGLLEKKELDVEVLAGCYFCIDYKVFKSIGFFDEATFIYGEESIIGWKLKNKGYKQRLMIQEKVIHVQNNSIGQDVSRAKTKNHNLLKTNKYFIKEYLKGNKLQLGLYQCLFTIGAVEKHIILKILKVLKNK